MLRNEQQRLLLVRGLRARGAMTTPRSAHAQLRAHELYRCQVRTNNKMADKGSSSEDLLNADSSPLNIPLENQDGTESDPRTPEGTESLRLRTKAELKRFAFTPRGERSLGDYHVPKKLTASTVSREQDSSSHHSLSYEA